VDEFDKKLLEILFKNGRAKLSDIAKSLGYTSMGIKRRLDKLMRSGLVQISALVNFRKIKLLLALIYLEVENANYAKRIIRRFEKCPRVINIFTTLGGYNLIALVFAEDLDTMESISIEKCSLRSQPGVRRSEFYPVGEVYYSHYLPIRFDLAHKSLDISPCGVDCKTCTRFINSKCAGCAATKIYRGQI